MRKSVQGAKLLVTATLLGTAVPAAAVDGTILIDQNKAMTGNVTPGDTPGFPVSINQPGSYKLAGNLVVPNATTTAIEINASHVTLDLNGFAILGPTDCAGGLNSCANSGTGSAIATPVVEFNITVRNGTIQGMGATGIRLLGDSHLVEYVHVRSNGNGGILILQSADSGGSIVQHNTVERNGTLTGNTGAAGGIHISRGLVRDNVVDVNFTGIVITDVGTVTHNVVTRNADVGLIMTEGNYIGNVFNGNAVNVAPGGGINQGQNLCGGAACPNAFF